MEEERTFTAFLGETLIASGHVETMLPVVKAKFDRDESSLFLIFEDQSGRQVDFDLVDSNDLRNRAETTCPLGPGRFAHARGAACVSEPRP